MLFHDEGGENYSLPLHSSATVGALYSPDGDVKKALKGYSFKTVGDLVACSIPPKVVGVRKTYRSHQAISSVNATEILIITKIGSATINQKCYIKAFSLSASKLLYRSM